MEYCTLQFHKSLLLQNLTVLPKFITVDIVELYGGICGLKNLCNWEDAYLPIGKIFVFVYFTRSVNKNTKFYT